MQTPPASPRPTDSSPPPYSPSLLAKRTSTECVTVQGSRAVSRALSHSEQALVRKATRPLQLEAEGVHKRRVSAPKSERAEK
jgi:hypothetical protein